MIKIDGANIQVEDLKKLIGGTEWKKIVVDWSFEIEKKIGYIVYQEINEAGAILQYKVDYEFDYKKRLM